MFQCNVNNPWRNDTRPYLTGNTSTIQKQRPNYNYSFFEVHNVIGYFILPKALPQSQQRIQDTLTIELFIIKFLVGLFQLVSD